MGELGFDGRVAIVTGAGGGLGRAHALLLARHGAQVVVNDLGGSVSGEGSDAGAAQLVVGEIEAAGGVAVADTSSVAEPAGGEAIVAAAMEAFGRVDILVNNAGIVRDRSFAKLSTSDLDRVLDVHLRGAFFITRPAWEVMRGQGFGRIVNTTSAAGLFGNFGQTNYGAAKMGLVGLTKALAQEGARHNITANAIAPMAHTRMTEGILGPDTAALLDPALVSPLVAYLAHETCEVTGRVFSVGGGRVGEVFFGETRGFFHAGLTPEALQDNWEAVCDREGFAVPQGIQDELGLLLPHVS